MIRPELLPRYTIQDWRRWPGEWELVEGIPYAMAPSPTIRHQLVRIEITRQLAEGLDACQECFVLDETDWIVSESSVVRPDVMVICGEIEGDYPTQTPRAIFEIVSPSTALYDERLKEDPVTELVRSPPISTALYDERLKFELYEREGVAFYVLVYPERRLAKVYRLQAGRYVKMGDFQKGSFLFEIGDACRVKLDFGRLWRRLPSNDRS